MPPKRKGDESSRDTEPGPSGRERKKQKTAASRNIDVQTAGPSKPIVLDSLKGLPTTIDVEKFAEARAFEINAFQTAIKTARAGATHRVWQTLPRHLRRRAASHDVRRVPVRLRMKAKLEMDAVKKKTGKKGKKGKKNMISRAESFLKRQRDKTWLETHIWHAKRMKMKTLWGYRLAVHPTEKSFRPSHRASIHGSILHDVSYYSLIEVKGKESLLKGVLAKCCDPMGISPVALRYTTGGRACETHMYKPNAYPFDLISPATIIWRPPPSPTLPNPPVASKKGKEKEVPAIDTSNTTRTIWIRSHPSVFDNIFQSLKDCISETLSAVPGEAEEEIELSDLRDSVNAFDVMGPKASQVIKGALRLVKGEDREELKKVWNSLGNLQSSTSVPRGMILGLTIYDPRLDFPPKNAKVETTQPQTFVTSPSALLASTELWEEDRRTKLGKPHFKKKDLDERRSRELIPGTRLRPLMQDDRVPIMLIQRSVSDNAIVNNTSSSGVHGWTLLVPSGWSMPFFSSLTYTGTRVAGLRERKTQFFESRQPSFPEDFPTTSANATWAAEIGREEKERWSKKPPAKRFNYEKVLGSDGIRSNPWIAHWGSLLGIGEPELIPTQPIPDGATSANVTPWLLRAPDVAEILASAAESPSSLLTLLDTLRLRKGMPALSKLGAEDLLRGTLVQVRVKMVTRGSVGDMAVIYSMDEQEESKWRAILSQGKTNDGKDGHVESEDEITLSKLIPKTSSIVGYVTSGNFSLSLGQGFGIGVVPASFLIKTTTKDNSIGDATWHNLVKVREKEGVVCRLASLEILTA